MNSHRWTRMHTDKKDGRAVNLCASVSICGSLPFSLRNSFRRAATPRVLAQCFSCVQSVALPDSEDSTMGLKSHLREKRGKCLFSQNYCGAPCKSREWSHS